MSNQPLTLEAIYSLPTRRIMRGSLCVGHLYVPKLPGDQWEVWPTYQATQPFLDAGTSAFVGFLSEADALAFLGIGTEDRIAA